MQNNIVKKIGKYVVVFSFILSLIVLFINLFIVFFSSKSTYQEETVEYIGMWVIPFFISFGIGVVLLVFAFFSENMKHYRIKSSAFFIITIFSLLISGYLQYMAYTDYWGEPQKITETLESVNSQYAQLGSGAKSHTYYYFILKTTTKGWDTKYYYYNNESEVLSDLYHFQQYLGKELSFTYSSYYNHLAYIQDPEGNYIYRASQLYLDVQ